MAEVTGKLLRLPTGSQVTGAGGSVGFPANNFPKERVFCIFQVFKTAFLSLCIIPFVPKTD